MGGGLLSRALVGWLPGVLVGRIPEALIGYHGSWLFPRDLGWPPCGNLGKLKHDIGSDDDDGDGGQHSFKMVDNRVS